ncbi:MAG: ABC transporter permease [Acidobacteria bacterium]|nr:ABC transporter permease [Acidobacteriota bacterium]
MRVFNTDLGENFRMAIVTLWQNKLRSFLTILGVVIGTITTIVIAAFVSGIDARVSKEIEAFGSNSIYAFKFDPGFNINPSMEERTRKPLKEEDADAIRAECSNCEVRFAVYVARGFHRRAVHRTRQHPQQRDRNDERRGDGARRGLFQDGRFASCGGPIFHRR